MRTGWTGELRMSATMIRTRTGRRTARADVRRGTDGSDGSTANPTAGPNRVDAGSTALLAPWLSRSLGCGQHDAARDMQLERSRRTNWRTRGSSRACGRLTSCGSRRRSAPDAAAPGGQRAGMLGPRRQPTRNCITRRRRGRSRRATFRAAAPANASYDCTLSATFLYRDGRIDRYCDRWPRARRPWPASQDRVQAAREWRASVPAGDDRFRPRRRRTASATRGRRKRSVCDDVGTNDLDKARAYLRRLLGEIGATGRWSSARFHALRPASLVAYPASPARAIGEPCDREPATWSTVHAKAWSSAARRGRAGIALAGRRPGFYGAYFRDPEGNKLCAFRIGPA